ncbi:MAG: hypothetical protein ACOYN6_01905 [Ignavibacteria bacterium]
MLETLTISISVLCLALIVFLILIYNKLQRANFEISRKEYIIMKVKGEVKQVGVQYFTEENYSDGLFSKKHIVSYKMQLLVDNLPIGIPSEIKKERFRKVDKQQVNKSLEDFAKPLMDAGIRVVVSKLIMA